MIFGSSDLSERLRDKVRRVAQAHAEVLVTGPSGSGISKVAEVIHLSSQRSKGPFVKRAAAGLSPDDVSDALHAASGGSLFLDEVAQLPAQTQLSLIEALDQVHDVRLIAGSARALQALVTEGQFHADLYYRLEVMTVRIPSLSERPEDIATMFRRYVDQAAEQSGVQPPEVTPQMIAGLMARDCAARRARRVRRQRRSSCRARLSMTSWPATGFGQRTFAARLCGFSHKGGARCAVIRTNRMGLVDFYLNDGT
jgi:two-component system C4-dicarboxylate transport response regulator DctD